MAAGCIVYISRQYIIHSKAGYGQAVEIGFSTFFVGLYS